MSSYGRLLAPTAKYGNAGRILSPTWIQDTKYLNRETYAPVDIQCMRVVEIEVVKLLACIWLVPFQVEEQQWKRKGICHWTDSCINLARIPEGSPLRRPPRWSEQTTDRTKGNLLCIQEETLLPTKCVKADLHHFHYRITSKPIGGLSIRTDGLPLTKPRRYGNAKIEEALKETVGDSHRFMDF